MKNKKRKFKIKPKKTLVFNLLITLTSKEIDKIIKIEIKEIKEIKKADLIIKTEMIKMIEIILNHSKKVDSKLKESRNLIGINDNFFIMFVQ